MNTHTWVFTYSSTAKTFPRRHLKTHLVFSNGLGQLLEQNSYIVKLLMTQAQFHMKIGIAAAVRFC